MHIDPITYEKLSFDDAYGLEAIGMILADLEKRELDQKEMELKAKGAMRR